MIIIVIITGHTWYSFIFLPNTTPKFDEFLNLRHFSFSSLLSFQCFEKPLLSRWNLMLSCFLFLFSLHFSNLTFLCLIFSIHCSLEIFKLLELSSLLIWSFNCFKISFSFLLAFLLTFLLKSYCSSLLSIDATPLSPSLIFALVNFLH